MSIFDEARALAVTMKMRGFNQKEMAHSLGVSQSYVANKLRLLQLPEDMQEQIISNGLTERHARAIMRLKDERDRRTALDRVCNEKLTVAGTEELVDFYYLSSKDRGTSEADILLQSLDSSIKSLQMSGIRVEKQVIFNKNEALIAIHITV